MCSVLILRDLLDPLGIAAVVRERMMRIGHADLGIGPHAAFAAHHHRDTRVRSVWNATTCRSNISFT